MAFVDLETIPDFGTTVFDLAVIDFTVLPDQEMVFVLIFNDPDLAGVSIVLEIREEDYSRGFFVDKKLEGFAVDASTGDYLCYGPSGYIFGRRIQQHFDDQSIVDKQITFNYGELTRAKKIEEGYLVLGMAQQVYRGEPFQWQFLADEILDQSLEKCHFSGFFDAAQIGQDNYLFVGVEGSAWVYQPSGWSRATTPTNLDLHSLCHYKGNLWAAGQLGTLLKYEDGLWYDYTLEDKPMDISLLEVFGEFLMLIIAGELYFTRFTEADGFEPLVKIESIAAPVIRCVQDSGKLYALARTNVWEITTDFQVQILAGLSQLQSKKINVG